MRYQQPGHPCTASAEAEHRHRRVRHLHSGQCCVDPELWRTVSERRGHFECVRRVGGEPGGQQADGQEAADALDTQRGPPAASGAYPRAERRPRRGLLSLVSRLRASNTLNRSRGGRLTSRAFSRSLQLPRRSSLGPRVTALVRPRMPAVAAPCGCPHRGPAKRPSRAPRRCTPARTARRSRSERRSRGAATHLAVITDPRDQVLHVPRWPVGAAGVPPTCTTRARGE